MSRRQLPDPDGVRSKELSLGRLPRLGVLSALVGALGCSSPDSGGGLDWQPPASGEAVPTWDAFREAHTAHDQSGREIYVVLDDVYYDDIESLYIYWHNRFSDEAVAKKGVGATTAGGALIKWPTNSLKYCLASPSHWGGTTQRQYIRALMTEAMLRWSHEADMTWTEVELGTACENSEPVAGNVDFAVVKDAVNTMGGHAFFPDVGVSGRKIWIGTGIFAGPPGYPYFVTNGTILYGGDMPFIVHEVGHTLGLEHEHGHTGTWAPSPAVPDASTSNCSDLHPLNAGYGTNVDLTAGIDYCSVMASWGCGMNGDWLTANCPEYFQRIVSLEDGVASRALYGAPRWYNLNLSTMLLGM